MIMADWLWTWGGESFGFRDGNTLFAADGRQVGRFYENEVYGQNGDYLGELGDSDRLITRQARLGRTKSPFVPRIRMGKMQHLNRLGRLMRLGCQDFPSADQL